MNIHKPKRIVICGYGEYGKKLFDYCSRISSYNVLAVGDNDTKKHGHLHADIHCMPIKDTINISDVEYIISVQNKHLYNDIYKELRSLDVDEQLIHAIPQEILLLWRDESRKLKLTPKPVEKFRYEVNITKYCNLNCAYCNHFAPLSSYDDKMDINIYTRDVRRLSEIFRGGVFDILILGGEPLLHPDLSLFMKETRKNFRKANVTVITNGVLLKNMDNSFWKACNEWDISLTVTYYPIKLDYDNLMELANSHNVKMSIFKGHLSKISMTDSEFSFTKYPLNLKGDNDKAESFMDCDLANGCITLDNGRLYTCSVIPNSYIFKKYFDVDLPKCEDNGIDIYDKSLTAEEVLSKLATPTEFCKFCNVTSKKSESWKVSEHNINEWT